MTLGLELSSSARSVALWVDGTGESPTVVRSPLNEDPRTTRAFELIEKALQARGAMAQDVTHIVLGLGPWFVHRHPRGDLDRPGMGRGSWGEAAGNSRQ